MRGVYIYGTCAFLGGLCRVSDLMTGVCGIFPRFSGLSRCIVLDTRCVLFDPPCKTEWAKFSFLTGVGVFANIFEWYHGFYLRSFVLSCST